VPLLPDRDGDRRVLGIPPGATLVAMLPGSRRSEIDRLAPVFLDAAAKLLERHPDLWLVAPMANDRSRAQFESHFAAAARRHAGLALMRASGRLLVRVDVTAAALGAANAAVLASGTAALEAMLAKVPTVIGYVVAPMTAWLVRTFGLIRSRYYALPNVLADAPLMPELLQAQCTAPRIAAAIESALGMAPSALAQYVERCSTIHVELRRDADVRAADAISEILDRRRAAG